MFLSSKGLKIQVIDEDIFINGKKINKNIDVVDLLQEKTKHIDTLEIDKIKDKFNKSECIVLLAISFNIKKLTDKFGNQYEITFSYHFPLNYEKSFIKLLLSHLDYAASGHLINLATYGDFIACSVNEDFNYLKFQKKYSYLIRRNDCLISLKVDNVTVPNVLKHWNKYCNEKFNKNFSKDAIAAYNYFYSTDNFHTISLINSQGISIAEGIVYESKETNTLYYCIFWWDKYYKSLSLGIYNYVKIINYCNRKKLNFSFCYGLQDYKIKLLNPFLKNKINSLKNFKG